MNMETDTSIPTPLPEGTAASGTSTVPSLNRSELIEKYREQSLQKANPLAANLALINCDLMVFAQGNAESVSPPPSWLKGSPEALQQFERQANLQLRIVRQIDRLARMDEQLENGGKFQTHDGAEAKN